MNNRLIKTLCFCFFLSFLTNSFGQTPTDSLNTNGSRFYGNPIQTAVPFLRINPEARAGGMGDTGLATKPDATSVQWNSAKIPFAKKPIGINLAYTPWLANLGVDDVYMLAGGGYYKLDEYNSLNFGIKYFSLGETVFRQNAFDTGTPDNPQEFAIQGGYSRKVSDVTGLGVNLKYINSDLASGQNVSGFAIKTGQAIAGDLNFYFDPLDEGKTADWSFAATISNLGSKISYLENDSQKDFLPTNLGLGADVIFEMANESDFEIGLDLNKLLVPTPKSLNDTSYRDESVIGGLFSSFGDAPGGFSEELEEWQVSVGTEYSFRDQFFGRAGYFYENKNKGNRNYLTLGAGLNWDVTTVNFAYLFSTGNSYSPLDKTLRFSVEFDLN